MVLRPKIMLFNICKFHLQFWQMCKLFANKLFSLNTYFYSSVWIIMVHSNFDAKNLHSICLRISPQIFAILQKFALDNFRDQQFCNLLCEWEWVVMVLFTGNALEVEVPPGMVWHTRHTAGAQWAVWNNSGLSSKQIHFFCVSICHFSLPPEKISLSHREVVEQQTTDNGRASTHQPWTHWAAARSNWAWLVQHKKSDESKEPPRKTRECKSQFRNLDEE